MIDKQDDPDEPDLLISRTDRANTMKAALTDSPSALSQRRLLSEMIDYFGGFRLIG